MADLTAVPSVPVDPATARTLVDVVDADKNASDRDAVEAAIVAVAAERGGTVDPNAVRARLRSTVGPTLNPRVVGGVYFGLVKQGRLVPSGWTTSTDSDGGNAGKPARTYRLVEAPQGRAS